MTYRLLIAGLICYSFMSCGQQIEEKEIIIEREIDPTAEPGIIHSVYFYLNEDVSAEQVDTFMDELHALEAIPSIKRLFIGPPAATEERGVVDNSFGIALIVWFDDLAGHDLYQEHQIHLDFIESSKDLWREVKVYDNLVR